MQSTSSIRMAWRSGSPVWLGPAVVLVTVLVCQAYANPAQPEPLFTPPPVTAVCDEVFLVSTRAIGTSCDADSMQSGLLCQRLVESPMGQATWEIVDWRRLLTSPASLPTIFYVHGNRVAPGKDAAQGMQVYRSLKAHRPQPGPVRFVIWSWPSEPIPGPIKDYLVKAQRTNPAAWQLAWMLDQLPSESDISLVGYSYGTRVVSGAIHLLAGGQLGTMKLNKRAVPQKNSVRAALLAAAYDSDWLEPNQFYGQALSQIEWLVVATNTRDPAMRFYHFSTGPGRKHALGKSGVHQPAKLAFSLSRLQYIDYTHEVGRSHSLQSYLAADQKMHALWQQLLGPQQASLVTSNARMQPSHYNQN